MNAIGLSLILWYLKVGQSQLAGYLVLVYPLC